MLGYTVMIYRFVFAHDANWLLFMRLKAKFDWIVVVKTSKAGSFSALITLFLGEGSDRNFLK